MGQPPTPERVLPFSPKLESSAEGVSTRAGAPVGQARVWVVEDSPMQLEATRTLLAADFAVEGFTTGEALLERLAEGRMPELVVLDQELPGISGLEVCRFIRERADESALPILLLTSKRTSADIAEGLAAGANDHVSKPFQDVELRARVRTLVRLSQHARAIREREARLSTTLSSIGDGVVSTDAQGRVTFMNPVAQALTGWSEAEAAGRPMAEIFRILNEYTRLPVPSPVDRVIAEGVAVGLANHTLLVRRDGTEIPIDDSAAPLRDLEGRLLGVVLVFREISERKHLEREREALLDREQTERARLTHLLAQSPVGIAILEGPAHAFAFANPAFLALVNRRDVAGKAMLEALPDLQGQGFEVLLDRVVSSGESFSAKEQKVTLAQHGPGEALVVNLTFTPMRDGRGRVQGVLASLIDVTEQVQARKRVDALAAQVHASEAERRLVMDAIPLLISFVTADETYGLVNKAYEDWFGHPQASLVGRPVREVIGEAAYAVLGPQVKRGLAGERFIFEQYGVPYRHGGTRDVKVAFVPHRNAAGAVEGYVALMEDITERRRLEQDREQLLVREEAAHRETEQERERLRVSEERLRRVVEASGAGLWEVDIDSAQIHADPRMVELMGFPAGSTFTLQSALSTLAAPADRERVGKELAQAMAGENGGRTQSEFLTGDHGAAPPRWAESRAQVTFDGSGRATHLAGVVIDVTARKVAELERQHQAEFEKQLIGIVSHDLRNPLNVIGMAASIMASGELPPPLSRSVQRIQRAADRATGLVRDLLDFTQARLGGGIRVEAAPTDLSAVTRQVLDEVQSAHPGRIVEAALASDTQGEWDAGRLGQVVQNLLTNALKYGPETTAVQVTTVALADGVSLAVHNAGAPIPLATLQSLFEPLKRGVAQTDSAGRSIGLGLYIVKQVVDAHRGTIAVESTEHAGTTFTVRLPRKSSR